MSREEEEEEEGKPGQPQTESINTEKCHATAEQAKERFGRFADLFKVPAQMGHLPEGEESAKLRQAARACRDHLAETLAGIVDRAVTTVDQLAKDEELRKAHPDLLEMQTTALESMATLAKILEQMPRSEIKVEQTKERGVHLERRNARGETVAEDFQGISFKVTPPRGMKLLRDFVDYVQIDVVLNRKTKGKPDYTPQQIRVNVYGGRGQTYELASLRMDAHRTARDRVQLDVEGSALGNLETKHVNLPWKCSDEEVFGRLLNVFALGLIPKDGKHNSEIEYHLETLYRS